MRTRECSAVPVGGPMTASYPIWTTIHTQCAIENGQFALNQRAGVLVALRALHLVLIMRDIKCADENETMRRVQYVLRTRSIFTSFTHTQLEMLRFDFQ